ncbi:MAG: hypothetical protein JO298_09355 [Verrucomicrobia bacterium]|nr:hypothetical protein [Verrucomicrobiota bacterium]MBV9644346.1 hypothetical protein [Verrucomicrobiota bacterium]
MNLKQQHPRKRRNEEQVRIRKYLTHPEEIRCVAKQLGWLALVSNARRGILGVAKAYPQEFHIVTHSDLNGKTGLLVGWMFANGKSCEFALLFEVDRQLISHAAAICAMQKQSEKVLRYSIRRFGVSVTAAGIRKESNAERSRSNNGKAIQHTPA